MNLAALIALTDEIAPALVAIPRAADDVCPDCHTARDPRYERCYSCGRIAAGFGLACPTVVPISFYTRPADDEPPSVLRDIMHDYKEHDSADVRSRAGTHAASILVRYLIEHGPALQASIGPWDHLVTVPSKKHDGRPVLENALEPFAALLPPVQPWLRTGPGVIGRSKPADDGFETTTDIAGRRVLLIDDTFTTGATVHSAAHTLLAAHAHLAGAVVIARKINLHPEYPHTLDVWARQIALGPFSFTNPPFWT